MFFYCYIAMRPSLYGLTYEDLYFAIKTQKNRNAHRLRFKFEYTGLF